MLWATPSCVLIQAGPIASLATRSFGAPSDARDRRRGGCVFGHQVPLAILALQKGHPLGGSYGTDHPTAALLDDSRSRA